MAQAVPPVHGRPASELSIISRGFPAGTLEPCPPENHSGAIRAARRSQARAPGGRLCLQNALAPRCAWMERYGGRSPTGEPRVRMLVVQLPCFVSRRRWRPPRMVIEMRSAIVIVRALAVFTCAALLCSLMSTVRWTSSDERRSIALQGGCFKFDCADAWWLEFDDRPSVGFEPGGFVGGPSFMLAGLLPRWTRTPPFSHASMPLWQLVVMFLFFDWRMRRRNASRDHCVPRNPGNNRAHSF